MKRLIALALLASPAAASAQRVTIAERGSGAAAALVDSVTAGPHVVRAGSGMLVFPRDSTITTSLLVLGRPTYLASRVQGDVVVVGGDLFLRPGAEVSGRAVAIGGTVAETSLGSVGGGVRSLRDETFDVARDATGGGFTLTARTDRVEGDAPRMFRLAGIRGLKLPRYDRVDGLSLPVGVQLVARDETVFLEPTLTYRSRLGVVDPGLTVRLGAEEDARRLEGRVARDTRSNDTWITGDAINSLRTLLSGTDTRNYFRADLAEARVFLPLGNDRVRIEAFAGGRVERVSPITATGTVYSFTGRRDTLRMARPNPLVEKGDLGSALAGLRYESRPEAESPVSAKARLELEQGFSVPAGTRPFTQLTLDGSVQLPTIRTHQLRIRAHGVATLGDSTPRARWAYLGGSRTLRLTELLALGGDQLVFVDSRYLIPIESVQLPVVGPPMLSFLHRLGGAGVGSVGPLQQEVGAGLSFGSPMFGSLDFELITGASGQHRTRFDVGITLPSF